MTSDIKNSTINELVKALTISMLVRWPYVKTMALGGLETGSRKEKDTQRAVGTSMYKGFTPIASAWQRQFAMRNFKKIKSM